MSTKDDGVQAFPCLPPLDAAGQVPAGYPYPSDGMTLRDYFAARALQALVLAVAQERPPSFDAKSRADIARVAYMYADDMLKARGA